MHIDKLRRRALTVSDLRDMAKKNLPRGIFEYVARGTDEDRAITGNATAFDQITALPRVLRDVSGATTDCTILGKPSPAPIIVAPTGFAGLLWQDGEIAAAKAAEKAGLPYTISTGSIVSMERIREVSAGRLWMQIYVWPKREMTLQLMKRGQAAGYETLIITVDTPIAPYRPYNERNGFSIPFKVGPRNVLDVLQHPKWLMNVVVRRYLTSGPMFFENYPEELRVPVGKAQAGKFSLPFTDNLVWDEIAEIRRHWKGPVLLKGILHPDDAERAVTCGVDGIIVSNHGGRNLDSAIAPVRVLPLIADRVAGRIAVYIDSGITRGSDIAKAVALGADAVLTGKAPLFGIAAAGEAGALRALELMTDELKRFLASTGARDLSGLDRQLFALPQDFVPPNDQGAKGIL